MNLEKFITKHWDEILLTATFGGAIYFFFRYAGIL